MNLLFIILLLLLIFGIIRPLWRVYRTFSHVRDAFSGCHAHNRSKHEAKQQSKPKDEKIIPDEYGEYVEFTETTSYSDDTIKQETTIKEYKEEQISDAEWEDVK